AGRLAAWRPMASLFLTRGWGRSHLDRRAAQADPGKVPVLLPVFATSRRTVTKSGYGPGSSPVSDGLPATQSCSRKGELTMCDHAPPCRQAADPEREAARGVG